MKGHSWNNVHGSITVELNYDPVIGWYDDAGRLFPYLVTACLPHPPEEDYGDITIHFISAGYYQPAKIWGLPEDCYPEESSDERIATMASFEGSGCDVILTRAALRELEAMYEWHIYDAEIDFPEPDYDAIREAREESY